MVIVFTRSTNTTYPEVLTYKLQLINWVTALKSNPMYGAPSPSPSTMRLLSTTAVLVVCTV